MIKQYIYASGFKKRRLRKSLISFGPPIIGSMIALAFQEFTINSYKTLHTMARPAGDPVGYDNFSYNREVIPHFNDIFESLDSQYLSQIVDVAKHMGDDGCYSVAEYFLLMHEHLGIDSYIALLIFLKFHSPPSELEKVFMTTVPKIKHSPHILDARHITSLLSLILYKYENEYSSIVIEERARFYNKSLIETRQLMYKDAILHMAYVAASLSKEEISEAFVL